MAGRAREVGGGNGMEGEEEGEGREGKYEAIKQGRGEGERKRNGERE